MSGYIEYISYFKHPSGIEYYNCWGVFEDGNLVLVDNNLDNLTRITGLCVFPEEMVLAQSEQL